MRWTFRYHCFREGSHRKQWFSKTFSSATYLRGDASWRRTQTPPRAGRETSGCTSAPGPPSPASSRRAWCSCPATWSCLGNNSRHYTPIPTHSSGQWLRFKTITTFFFTVGSPGLWIKRGERRWEVRAPPALWSPRGPHCSRLLPEPVRSQTRAILQRFLWKQNLPWRSWRVVKLSDEGRTGLSFMGTLLATQIKQDCKSLIADIYGYHIRFF